MIKKIILLITIGLSALSYSQSNIGKSKSRKIARFDEKMIVFERFLSCSDFIKSQSLVEFEKCLNKSIDNDLSANIKYVFKEFLFFNNRVGSPGPCDKETALFFEARTNPPEHYLCFSTIQDNIKRVGTVFFIKKGEKFFINKIQY